MMSDGTPTELSHGSHSPARADTFDMLHREKNLLSNITGRRLEPFNQDVEDQVSHLLAKIITPQMEVPMKYSSFDAYCRQSNALDEEIAKRIDEYQAGHKNWMTEGGKGGEYRQPTPAHRQSTFVPTAGQVPNCFRIAQSVTGLTTCSPKTASHFSRCRSNS